MFNTSLCSDGPERCFVRWIGDNRQMKTVTMGVETMQKDLLEGRFPGRQEGRCLNIGKNFQLKSKVQSDVLRFQFELVSPIFIQEDLKEFKYLEMFKSCPVKWLCVGWTQESKQEGPTTSNDPRRFGRTACRKRCRDRNRKGSRGLKTECGSTGPRHAGH